MPYDYRQCQQQLQQIAKNYREISLVGFPQLQITEAEQLLEIIENVNTDEVPTYNQKVALIEIVGNFTLEYENAKKITTELMALEEQIGGLDFLETEGSWQKAKRFSSLKSHFVKLKEKIAETRRAAYNHESNLKACFSYIKDYTQDIARKTHDLKEINFASDCKILIEEMPGLSL